MDARNAEVERVDILTKEMNVIEYYILIYIQNHRIFIYLYMSDTAPIKSIFVDVHCFEFIRLFGI